mmetsp:Transcript_149170/g.212016  ORF Transcript_149170/g.212016 Transcript_149170/m.212016 type:complete len:163 (+) Transcript_149170:41-529(+)
MNPYQSRGYDEFLRGPMAQQMPVPMGTTVSPAFTQGAFYTPPTVRPVVQQTVTVPERAQFTAPTFYSSNSHQRVLPDAFGTGGINNWIRMTAANNNMTPSQLLQQVGMSPGGPIDKKPKRSGLHSLVNNSNKSIWHTINEDELVRQMAPFLQGSPHVLDHAM